MGSEMCIRDSSTSTPCEWVEEFCAVLPESVEQAKDIIDDGEFF